jgi:hypothetical protein
MPVLFYIAFFVEVGAMLVGGFRYRSLPHPLRILEWLIIFNVGMACAEWTLLRLHIYNLWISHFSTMIELTAIVFMYSLWMKQHGKRRVLLICLVVFLFFWIISKFSFEPLSLADDWTATISKVLQIAFSAYLLLDVVKESDIVWTNDPRFWVAAGTIIYAAGSLFLFALFNKMLQISTERFLMIWPLNWVFIIISNLLYMRGFVCKE